MECPIDLRRLRSDDSVEHLGLRVGLDEPDRLGLRDAELLVVDDGLNYGRTMYQLILFCRAAGIMPVGGMVLDSRLNEKETRTIRSYMSRNHLVALYTWPASTGAR